MIKSISIKGIQNINELELVKPNKVNYLVGQNGAGKTSVMHALAILNHASRRLPSTLLDCKVLGAAENLFAPGAMINLVKEGGGGGIWFDNPSGNSVKINGRSHNLRLAHTRVSSIETYKDSIFKSRPISLPVDGKIAFDIQEQYLAFLRGQVNFTDLYIKHIRPATSNFIPSLEVYESEDSPVTEEPKYVPLPSLSTGLQECLKLKIGLYDIIDELREVNNNQTHYFVCLEEPEVHLYPGLQKMIPEILNELVTHFSGIDLYFFVATHSPFVIKAAAQYPKTQKVYLIEKGDLVDRAGKPLTSSSGYTGTETYDVAARMLGAGVGDVSRTASPREQVKLVFCEGEASGVRDSILYNEIFHSLDEPRFQFISCGGFSDALHSYLRCRDSLPYLLEQEGVYCLLDASNSSKDLPLGDGETISKTSKDRPKFPAEDRIRFLESEVGDFDGYRMLKRKELENYLFDPSVLEKIEVSPVDLFKDGKVPSDEEYENGEIKDKLKGDSLGNYGMQLAQQLGQLGVEYEKATDEQKETLRTGDKGHAIYAELRDCLLTKNKK